MEQANTPKRIHPLMAGAACSVILVSLLGAAAITGILPSSHGNTAPAANTQSAMDTSANLANPATNQSMYPTQSGANVANNAQNSYQTSTQPAKVAQVSSHHQNHNSGNGNYDQTRPYPAHAPAAQNSPVGIGVGAVIGGLLGSQVGNGNGRTLATIAGAVGGGYVGNEVAKRNP